MNTHILNFRYFKTKNCKQALDIDMNLNICQLYSQAKQ